LTRSLPSGLRGKQQPRFLSAPPAPTSAGKEAIDLARQAGLDLDPWQQLTLTTAMQENADGKWSAFEVGIVVARQNGKGSIIEARELAGLFILPEKVIVHTAHTFETSLEAFTRLCALIEGMPELDRQVRRVSQAHGKEGIQLRNGSRIKFKTRTPSGGRGLSGDLVILDEAMILSATAMGTLMPLVSARPNPQIWYTGSAVDADVHVAGTVFSGIRNRGIKGGDPRLAYLEWSCDKDVDRDDPHAWAEANPGMGYRISPEYIADERNSLRALGRTWEVERLSIGNWPDPDPTAADRALPLEKWRTLVDRAPKLGKGVCIALDMTPDRTWLTIAAAARRADGGVQVEVGYHGDPSTSRVLRIVLSLLTRWDPVAVVIDKASPVAAMLPHLADAGIEAETTGAAELAQAAGGLFDAVRDGTVWHTGDPLLEAAVEGAAERKLSGAWAFTRIGDAVISPVVAVSLARLGLLKFGAAVAPPPATPQQEELSSSSWSSSAGRDAADLLTTAF
jgi:hypothetical protein